MPPWIQCEGFLGLPVMPNLLVVMVVILPGELWNLNERRWESVPIFQVWAVLAFGASSRTWKKIGGRGRYPFLHDWYWLWDVLWPMDWIDWMSWLNTCLEGVPEWVWTDLTKGFAFRFRRPRRLKCCRPGLLRVLCLLRQGACAL